MKRPISVLLLIETSNLRREIVIRNIKEYEMSYNLYEM